jgi:hypothetical protein
MKIKRGAAKSIKLDITLMAVEGIMRKAWGPHTRPAMMKVTAPIPNPTGMPIANTVTIPMSNRRIIISILIPSAPYL